MEVGITFLEHYKEAFKDNIIIRQALDEVNYLVWQRSNILLI
jgi:hypothetical protein